MAKKKIHPASVLVWVLLAMLITGLAGFGVSGFGTRVRSIGSVGESEIDAGSYQRSVMQQMNAMSEQSGQRMDIAQAQAMGIPQAVLQHLVATTALEEGARRAGLSVGDATVGEQVRATPGFQGPTGEFDKESYKFILNRNGLTPEVYESGIRRSLTSELLQRAVVTGFTAPSTFADTLYSFLTESRSITFAPLNPILLPTMPPAPDEAAVQAYYDAHPDQFTAIASKDITYAWVSPAAYLDQVTVTDADLRKAYDAHPDRFQLPERRMVDRLGFADMDAAQAARDAIDAGTTTFDALLAERGLTEADTDLGAVSRADLDPQAAEAVFASEDNGVAGPAESAIGPALFRVNAILSAQETSFEEARDELRSELAEAAAEKLVEGEIQKLDDLLAGGATLEELANETAMELGTTSFTADAVPDTLPASLSEFRSEAAALTRDDFPKLTVVPGGIAFAMRLDADRPSELIPLAQVRQRAEAGASAAAIEAALMAQGETMKAAMETGKSFADLALNATSTGGISRQRTATEIPLELQDAAHEMQPGETRVVAAEGKVYLLRLDSVTAAATGTPQARQAIRQLTAEVTRAMDDDILAQMAAAYGDRAGITLNQTAINAANAGIQ